jgi:hypothetical protein
MAPLCAEFGISRKTGYKIFDRYKDCGLTALTDRSRRPYRQANRLRADRGDDRPAQARISWLGRAEDWRRAPQRLHDEPALQRPADRSRCVCGGVVRADPGRSELTRPCCSGYSMASTVDELVWLRGNCRTHCRPRPPGIIASSSSFVHGRVRLAVCARTVRTVAGSTGSPVCPHSRRT